MKKRFYRRPIWLNKFWPLGHFLFWLMEPIHQELIPDLFLMQAHGKEVRKRMWVEKELGGSMYERWEEHQVDEDDEEEEASWGRYRGGGRRGRRPTITWQLRLKALQWGVLCGANLAFRIRNLCVILECHFCPAGLGGNGGMEEVSDDLGH